MEVIQKAKILLELNDSSQDALLELYKSIAEEELSSFTQNAPSNLLAQMVVYKFQKKGMEAVSSAQYSDTRETYYLDYPTPIVNQIKALQRATRKLLTL